MGRPVAALCRGVHAAQGLTTAEGVRGVVGGNQREEAMKAFSTNARIRSTTERVWRTLMDTGGWPALDSSIDRVDGTPALGATVTVHGKVGRAFPLKVVDFVPNQRMVLAGGMPLGLFKGQRTYTVTSEGDGTVTFAMREAFSGPLAPLITRSIPDLQPSFDEFAANLKKRLEQP